MHVYWRCHSVERCTRSIVADQGEIPGIHQTAEHDARISNHWHSQIECGHSSKTETILMPYHQFQILLEAERLSYRRRFLIKVFWPQNDYARTSWSPVFSILGRFIVVQRNCISLVLKMALKKDNNLILWQNSHYDSLVGGGVASWLVCSTPEQFSVS